MHNPTEELCVIKYCTPCIPRWRAAYPRTASPTPSKGRVKKAAQGNRAASRWFVQGDWWLRQSRQRVCPGLGGEDIAGTARSHSCAWAQTRTCGTGTGPCPRATHRFKHPGMGLCHEHGISYSFVHLLAEQLWCPRRYSL